MDGATHTSSMTCVASEEMPIYSVVKLVGGVDGQVDGLPTIALTILNTDVMLGVVMRHAQPGDLVSVRFIFSGLLPAYTYDSVLPGDGLTIGLSHPGELSANDDTAFARKVAYVVQVSLTNHWEVAWAMVVFTRARYI